MNFEDFFNEFDILELCHLSPDTFEDEISLHITLPRIQNKTWSCFSFEDEWIEYLSSGGRCVTRCEHGCQFWTNPQYIIDTRNLISSLPAIVISLMQKHNRLKSVENPIERYNYIQVLFKMKRSVSGYLVLGSNLSHTQ